MYCFIFLLIFFIILGQSYKFSIHSSKYIIRTNIIGRYNCKIDDSGGGDGETPFLSALKEVFNEVGTENNFFFPGHCGGKFSPKSLNFLKNKINDEGSGDFFLYDLPELDGLDNIHCPEGPLLKSLQLASQLFGSAQTWYLVNGSTSGILAAICACARIHSRNAHISSHSSPPIKVEKSVLLLGRDSHKSAFDALTISGCDGVLLPCHFDEEFEVKVGLNIETIRSTLNKYGGRVCGLLITRPSYQGVACKSKQLQEISNLCHEYKVPLIVDEAHGSHLRFLDRPDLMDAISCGADIVVQSTHKTLTSLSQTGMMHLAKSAFKWDSSLNSCVGNTDDDIALILHECFSVLTSTSPNAIFLASLDATRAQMAIDGNQMIQKAAAAAEKIRNKLRESSGKNVILLDDSVLVKELDLIVDPLRLSVRFEGENSIHVDDRMCKENGIYCELNTRNCISYGIPPGSSDESLEILFNSLKNQFRILNCSTEIKIRNKNANVGMVAATYLNVDAVSKRKSKLTPLSNALDQVSAETISVYPPGIPIVIAGEVVCENHIEVLTRLSDEISRREQDSGGIADIKGSGCSVTGCSDATLKCIRVVYK